MSFEIYRNVEDDREVILLERYQSREAFAAHRDSQHFKDYVLDQIVPMLDGRVVESFDVR